MLNMNKFGDSNGLGQIHNYAATKELFHMAKTNSKGYMGGSVDEVKESAPGHRYQLTHPSLSPPLPGTTQIKDPNNVHSNPTMDDWISLDLHSPPHSGKSPNIKASKGGSVILGTPSISSTALLGLMLIIMQLW
jgi:hypothetical protein